MKGKLDVHEFAKAVIEILWHLSPVIVAVIAFNFWNMIKKEYEEGKWQS